MNQDEARGRADEFLDLHVRPQMPFEVLILDDYVKDQGDSWLFPYNGRGYIEERKVLEMIPGNTPIRVFKDSGEAGFDRRS